MASSRRPAARQKYLKGLYEFVECYGIPRADLSAIRKKVCRPMRCARRTKRCPRRDATRWGPESEFGIWETRVCKERWGLGGGLGIWNLGISSLQGALGGGLGIGNLGISILQGALGGGIGIGNPGNFERGAQRLGGGGGGATLIVPAPLLPYRWLLANIYRKI